uniref:Putative secreted protein n=1 Tax=Amblyomma parvum TaxID=251391 RepID=A0A023G2G5_AMBPA
MIRYLLAMHLFVIAMSDKRCQKQYLVDDYCDSDNGDRNYNYYTYDQLTQKCVPAETCGEHTRELLFETLEECNTKCNSRRQASTK